MKQKYLFLGLLTFIGIILSKTAYAVCPVCIVAVGAGLGLSRWLGVDDIVSSIWIGALLAATSIWTIIWLNKKGWGFQFQKIVIPAVYYLLVLVSLYYFDIAGHPLNKIWGIDKIIFGSAVGTAFFLASMRLHNFLKIKKEGKSFFPYQKVVIPVVILILISLLFYLLLIWRII